MRSNSNNHLPAGSSPTGRDSFPDLPTISVVMIDSRSDVHPDWVAIAKQSVQEQFLPCELVVVNNTGREATIGSCWNQGVRATSGDWVMFLGDDDWLSKDYLLTLSCYLSDMLDSDPRINHVSTSMFKHEGASISWDGKPCTGAFLREWLLRNQFDEELKSGVDAEFISRPREEDPIISAFLYTLPGYHRRKHSDNTCYVNRISHAPSGLYFWAGDVEDASAIFAVAKEMVQSAALYSEGFDAGAASRSGTVWIDRDLKTAIKMQDCPTEARRIVRLNAEDIIIPELFSFFDPGKWDVIITDDLDFRFTLPPHKGILMPTPIDVKRFRIGSKIPNSIAWIGNLDSVSGVGTMRTVARELSPRMSVFSVGTGRPEEVAIGFPHGVTHVYQHSDIPSFLADKEFFLFTGERHYSARQIAEAMASGCIPLIANTTRWMSVDYQGFTWDTIADIKQMIGEKICNPEELRLYCEKTYDISVCRQRIAIAMKESV